MNEGQAIPAAPARAQRPWLASYPAGVAAEIGEPPYRLLGEIPGDLAKARPDATAFAIYLPNGMSASLTYAQIDQYSDAFAAYLREVLRLRPGERVAIQIPNGLAYPVIAFGAFKAGCALVNVNPLYTAAEMAHLFTDAGPAAIVAIDMFADKLGAALKQAPVRHVVLSEAASFFPAPQRQFIGFAQKYLRREVSPARFAHERLVRALAAGEAAIRAGADVKSYAASLTPADIACLQYTGGTTGVSKAAMLTHRNLVMNIAQFLTFFGERIRPTDSVLTVLPLYHIFAFTANFLGLYVRGAKNIVIPNPRPLTNLRPAFEKEDISFLTGVNTLFNGLLHEPWFCANPPQSLRVAFAGGMALQDSVALRWRDLTGVPVIEGYGLTESSPVLTVNPAHKIKLGTVGVPLPSTEVKCVDDAGEEVAVGEHGELIARGPQVMAGYFNQPAETANAIRDGWLYTGDIAVMDAEGYFTIVDRRKDMILVSGFNVYPNQVEAALAKVPGVRECAVVGVPDEATGEAVKAFVVRADPDLSAETLRAFCRSELAAYKTPKYFEFRDELPKSNVGKILRKDLRWEGLLKRGLRP